MMGAPTEEWGELSSPDQMVCQTSTQEVQQTETINNSVRKGNYIIINIGNTILAAASEARIDEHWCLLENKLTCNTLINKNTSQIS